MCFGVMLALVILLLGCVGLCYCVFGGGWFGYIVGGCGCLCLLGCMDGLSFRVFLVWLIDMVMRFWWWCLRCVGWLFVWCSCLLSFVVLCDVWVLVIVVGGCCLIVI